MAKKEMGGEEEVENPRTKIAVEEAGPSYANYPGGRGRGGSGGGG